MDGSGRPIEGSPTLGIGAPLRETPGTETEPPAEGLGRVAEPAGADTEGKEAAGREIEGSPRDGGPPTDTPGPPTEGNPKLGTGSPPPETAEPVTEGSAAPGNETEGTSSPRESEGPVEAPGADTDPLTGVGPTAGCVAEGRVAGADRDGSPTDNPGMPIETPGRDTDGRAGVGTATGVGTARPGPLGTAEALPLARPAVKRGTHSEGWPPTPTCVAAATPLAWTVTVDVTVRTWTPECALARAQRARSAKSPHLEPGRWRAGRGWSRCRRSRSSGQSRGRPRGEAPRLPAPGAGC